MLNREAISFKELAASTNREIAAYRDKNWYATGIGGTLIIDSDRIKINNLQFENSSFYQQYEAELSSPHRKGIEETELKLKYFKLFLNSALFDNNYTPEQVDQFYQKLDGYYSQKTSYLINHAIHACISNTNPNILINFKDYDINLTLKKNSSNKLQPTITYNYNDLQIIDGLNTNVEVIPCNITSQFTLDSEGFKLEAITVNKEKNFSLVKDLLLNDSYSSHEKYTNANNIYQKLTELCQDYRDYLEKVIQKDYYILWTDLNLTYAFPASDLNKNDNKNDKIISFQPPHSSNTFAVIENLRTPKPNYTRSEQLLKKKFLILNDLEAILAKNKHQPQSAIKQFEWTLQIKNEELLQKRSTHDWKHFFNKVINILTLGVFNKFVKARSAKLFKRAHNAIALFDKQQAVNPRAANSPKKSN